MEISFHGRHTFVSQSQWFLVSVLCLPIGLTAAAKEPLPGEVMWQEGVAYRAEGQDLQRSGNLQRAISAYQKAVAANPRYAEAFNDLGVALESSEDAEHAEEAYKTALRLRPSLPAAHSNLALMYEEKGRIKEAAEHWGARIQLGVRNDPWAIRAREKLKQYQLPIPESGEELALKRRAEVQKAIAAGRAMMAAGRWEQASTEFRRGLALDPMNRDATRFLRKAEARAHKAQVRKERGTGVSRVRVKKKDAKEVQRAEMVRRRQEQLRGASAVEPTPESPPAAQQQPVPRAAAGREASAIAREYAKERAQARGKTVEELYQRAVVSTREGQFSEALDQFKQILVLDPNNRDAQRGLERVQKALALQQARVE